MNSQQQQLDTRALELALAAKTKIEDHEKRCYDLAEDNKKILNQVSTSVGAVHKRIDVLVEKRNDMTLKVRDGVIVLLLAIAGYLLVNGTPWS